MGINSKGPFFGTRHVQVLCVFLASSIAYIQRANISITILAMTSKYSSNPDVPIYDWDNKSVVLSSFYWAFMVLQIAAAPLGRKYGTKNVLMIVMFIDATASVLIPLMADVFGSYGVLVCRLIEGLVQGFVYPSVINVVSQWAPSSERSMFITLVHLGRPIAIIVTNPLSAFICSSWAGWPVTFYLFGAFQYIWIFFFFFLGADSPSEHKTISAEEKKYIESSVAVNANTKDLAIPWKAIFTSMPAWAIIVSNIGSSWGIALVLMELPIYLDKIMKLDLHSNGIITSVPVICAVFFSLLVGVLADYVINNSYASISFIRKFCTTLGSVIPAILFLIIGYLSEDEIVTVTSLLIVSECLTALPIVGALVNHIDLSPNFCGVISGIALCFGSTASTFAPLTVSFIVTDESDQMQWRILFIISAVIRIGCSLFYIAFASGTIQPWNSVDVNSKEIKKCDREEETSKANTG